MQILRVTKGVSKEKGHTEPVFSKFTCKHVSAANKTGTTQHHNKETVEFLQRRVVDIHDASTMIEALFTPTILYTLNMYILHMNYPQ